MPTMSETQMQPEVQAQAERPVGEKVLLSWVAPARPFKRRGRDFYISVVAVTALVGLVLFLVEGLMPIVLLVSLVFLFYVMSTVEPEQIEYGISDLGVMVGRVRTDWDQLGRFWFADRLGAGVLVIETNSFSGRMEVMVPKEMKDQVRQILSKYIVYEEVPASYWDKVATWLSRFLPE